MPPIWGGICNKTERIAIPRSIVIKLIEKQAKSFHFLFVGIATPIFYQVSLLEA